MRFTKVPLPLLRSQAKVIYKYCAFGQLNFQGLGAMAPMYINQRWATEGKDMWLYRAVKPDTETFDIEHYLTEAGIGYTFLEPKGDTTEQDTQAYNAIMSHQTRE